MDARRYIVVTSLVLSACRTDDVSQTSQHQEEADGTWMRPYAIGELPFRGEGTTIGGDTQVDVYDPCAPSTSEAGPEVVYRVEVTEPGFLWARVDDAPGDHVDIDVHLLAEANPDLCITRDNSDLGAPVQPGVYFVVLDTWTDDTFAGPYTLEIDLVTEAAEACNRSSIACDGMVPPFVNVDFVEAPGDPGCLPGMVRVADFCVDRFEAMVAEVTDDGLRPVSPYATPDRNLSLMALSVEGAVPQGHISQVMAADACSMAGKRLCTDAEWQRACRGSQGFTYPYGNEREPGRCNDARACHPATQTFESFSNSVYSNLDHPCISQLPEGLAVTGAHADCRTEDGVMDMMGNLHEWTSNPGGVFRGGFYVDTYRNGDGCEYDTEAHGVFYDDYSTGFRCCADFTE